jgi:hypothetical protein
MEVRVRASGEVFDETGLRMWLKANGGPSYETLTPEVMEALGVDPVFEGPAATGGTVYQYSMRQGVEQQADGKWYTKYVLGPIFANAQEQAEYETHMDAERAASVRLGRNKKLADCDWTQLADSTADKSAWATYRQALRDIPSQQGFPWNVTWPTEPGA